MNTPEKTILLFDFMRTLYDPESTSLYPNTYNILEKLHHDYEIYIISRNEVERRPLLSDLNIKQFLVKTFFTETKDELLFKKITENKSTREYIIIGDYAPEEIDIGNQLHIKTIWLRQGKFKNLYPKQKPWHTIQNITELEQLLLAQ
jgi:FMN phosphatase YigB (HAD superfamily)